MPDTTNDEWKFAEARAPLDTTGPLPLHVATLQYLEPDVRPQYVRTRAGDFRLAWIVAGDTATHAAAMAEIAAGRIAVYQPGDSPSAAAERAAERAQMDAAALGFIADAERQDAAARRAKHEARAAGLRADLEKALAGPAANAELAEIAGAIERQAAAS
jgi:hypothetical protein